MTSERRIPRPSRRDLLRFGAAGATAMAAGPVLGSSGTARASTAIGIDPTDKLQRFEGWGTALSWGANAIGRWDDRAKRTEIVDLLFGERHGLGLQIARYNIGATENPAHDHMRLAADIPSLWPHKPGEWDLTSDHAQRWVLERALEGSARTVEGFVTSPHYWWTKSGCVSGAKDKGNNLAHEHLTDFADYVTEVARVFARVWGIRFHSLSPVNEPSADWWVAKGTQEGCHFSRPYQLDVLDAVHRQLVSKGLRDRVRLAMSEEPGAAAMLQTLRSFGDRAHLLGQVNTHSYWDQDRAGLRDAVAKLPARLWMSEYGTSGDAGYAPQDISNALNLSRTMLRDLNELQANAWTIWNAIESQEANKSGNVSWGLIHATYTPGEEDFYIAKQYYGYGNYTKFVRPGSQVVRVDDPQAFAAYDRHHRRLVVVYTEFGEKDREVTFDLSGFAPAHGSVHAHRTSATENLARLRVGQHAHGSYRTTVKGESITTFVFPGLRPAGGDR